MNRHGYWFGFRCSLSIDVRYWIWQCHIKDVWIISISHRANNLWLIPHQAPCNNSNNSYNPTAATVEGIFTDVWLRNRISRTSIDTWCLLMISVDRKPEAKTSYPSACNLTYFHLPRMQHNTGRIRHCSNICSEYFSISLSLLCLLFPALFNSC